VLHLDHAIVGGAPHRISRNHHVVCGASDVIRLIHRIHSEFAVNDPGDGGRRRRLCS